MNQDPNEFLTKSTPLSDADLIHLAYGEVIKILFRNFHDSFSVNAKGDNYKLRFQNAIVTARNARDLAISLIPH